jgi:hypothetical protein
MLHLVIFVVLQFHHIFGVWEKKKLITAAFLNFQIKRKSNKTKLFNIYFRWAVYKIAICPCYLYSPFSVEDVLVFTDLIVTKGQREKFSMFQTKSKCQRLDCRDIKLKG